MVTKLTNTDDSGHNIDQMSPSPLSPVLERQLLLQLGDRLRHLRKAQGLGTVDMASKVGIARNTLRAIENGDPAPSIGAYLRVMSELGVGGDIALLAGDSLQAAPKGSAAARSRHAKPAVQVTVTAADSRHEVQDLQSLSLHQAAVDLVKADPRLLAQAQSTLARWIESGPSRSSGLWAEWEGILRHRQWRKVLGRSRHAQTLRQSSPLVTVLPDDVRRRVLDQVSELRKGVVMSDTSEGATP